MLLRTECVHVQGKGCVSLFADGKRVWQYVTTKSDPEALHQRP